MRRITVVGGSLAGVHAAEALREHGFDGDVTLVSAEFSRPYDRPPLSKQVLLGEYDVAEIALRPASWYEEQGIELRLGTAATAIDAKHGKLSLADGSELEYDGLVLATGSRPRALNVTGGAPGVHVLRSVEDAVALRPGLAAGRHLVMVGGGFIGLEVAGAAAKLGLEVTVIEASMTPLSRRFGDDVGHWYRELHERNGVRVICGSTLASVDVSTGGASITLSDGRIVKGDIVVAGVGSVPAVEWLAGSGIDTGDGVVCGPDLRTSVPNIVAAGDIASWRNPIFDERMRIEHWSNAVDQGRHAAATLLGDRQDFASVPYFWTDQHDTKMRFVGRTKDATDSRVEKLDDNKLIVTYGREGVLIGAVCVGSPRDMAKYKVAIQSRAPWDEPAAAVA